MVMKSALAEGSTVSRFSSSLRVSRFPVRAMTRSDTVGDSMNCGVAGHDPFWVARCPSSAVTKIRTTPS